MTEDNEDLTFEDDIATKLIAGIRLTDEELEFVVNAVYAFNSFCLN